MVMLIITNMFILSRLFNEHIILGDITFPPPPPPPPPPHPPVNIGDIINIILFKYLLFRYI